MPIEWEIDHARKLVLAWPRDEFDTEDLLGYLRAVWTKPEVAGYDEIVDMARATKVIYGSPWKIREVTLLAAEMDVPGVATKLAVVTASDQFQELGRMYQAFRAANPKSMKEVLVFATREEALKWLGRPAG